MVRPVMRSIARFFTFGLAFATSFLFDRTTKSVALRLASLMSGTSDTASVFSFVLHRNEGLAFSLLADSPRAALYVSVLAIFVQAVLAAYLVLHTEWPLGRAGAYGLGLMLGGSVGNLADRLLYGYVVDWFYVGVFINAADVFLCLGSALLAIDSLLQTYTYKASKK